MDKRRTLVQHQQPPRTNSLPGSKRRAGHHEGVCVGKSSDGKRWAISPAGTDDIVQLVFEKEFGLLIDLSGEPDKN